MIDLWEPGSFKYKEIVEGWIHHSGLWGLYFKKDIYHLIILSIHVRAGWFYSHEHANFFIQTFIEYGQDISKINISSGLISGVNLKIGKQVFEMCLKG